MMRFVGMGEFSGTDLEVAAILTPEPDFSLLDDAVAGDVRDTWLERLQDSAVAVHGLRESESDPLLSELESLRRQRTEIEHQMILLVAYMREKVKPRPYTLQQIANATGMSISGTRTFYDDSDVALLEERIATAKRAMSTDRGDLSARAE